LSGGISINNDDDYGDGDDTCRAGGWGFHGGDIRGWGDIYALGEGGIVYGENRTIGSERDRNPHLMEPRLGISLETINGVCVVGTRA
jgi:hypothetical protein